MIKPLLYLLQQSNLDSADRIRAVENVLGTCCTGDKSPDALDVPLREIYVATSLETSYVSDVLISALNRYPQLSCLPVRIYSAPTSQETTCQRAENPLARLDMHTKAISLALNHAGIDVLVQASSLPDGIRSILEAMAAGVPVLIPDHHGDQAAFVRDGINGFLYRAQDPDSLALSLLSLNNLPFGTLQNITAQAQATVSGLLAECGFSLTVEPGEKRP